MQRTAFDFVDVDAACWQAYVVPATQLSLIGVTSGAHRSNCPFGGSGGLARGHGTGRRT